VNETLQSEIAYRTRAEEGLRQVQAELARVSRMTAMGELTSSLAHEVNHPIGAIMMNAETCLRWLPMRSQMSREPARLQV
jgi:C4-dicarboxylate-specific signal transduction histidine kinase